MRFHTVRRRKVKFFPKLKKKVAFVEPTCGEAYQFSSSNSVITPSIQSWTEWLGQAKERSFKSRMQVIQVFRQKIPAFSPSTLRTLELGILDFARQSLRYGSPDADYWNHDFFRRIYKRRAFECLSNLTNMRYGQAQSLTQKIQAGDIDAYEFGFSLDLKTIRASTPLHIRKERMDAQRKMERNYWATLYLRRHLPDMSTDIAVTSDSPIQRPRPTHGVKCSHCKSYDISISQMQTRSADEPMTTFCYCENCKRRWRF